eukprot:gene14351-22016_t
MAAKDEDGDLREVFSEYVTFGTRSSQGERIDSTRFARMVRQLVLVDRHTMLSINDADVAFRQVASRHKTHKLGFCEFIEALSILAATAFPHLHPNQGLAALVDSIVYVFLSSKHGTTLRKPAPIDHSPQPSVLRPPPASPPPSLFDAKPGAAALPALYPDNPPPPPPPPFEALAAFNRDRDPPPHPYPGHPPSASLHPPVPPPMPFHVFVQKFSENPQAFQRERPFPQYPYASTSRGDKVAGRNPAGLTRVKRSVSFTVPDDDGDSDGGDDETPYDEEEDEEEENEYDAYGRLSAPPPPPSGQRRTADLFVPRPGYHTAHTAVPTFRMH